jgi:cell shape-determining protein MreC
MSDFCVKCSEKEAQLELLMKRHYDEMQCMKAKIESLKNENESLSFDLAFYEGRITNLSCNGK